MKKKILIVDDELVSLKSIEIVLKSADNDLKISTALNGKEAYAKAKVIKPDLIILDWDMPELNGLDTLKMLKATPRLSEIPVIMATGFTESEKLEIALQAGAADYIRKPIDKIELKARIESIFRLLSSMQYIKTQNDTIDRKNKEIVASLTYARRIQKAILPSADDFLPDFPELFILYKPKEIVSGDLYWYTKLKKTINLRKKEIHLIATLDCTGHGVPGAFMSLLGHAFLNQIVTIQKTTDPGKILTLLHKNIDDVLKHDDEDVSDGMDIALCAFDLEEKTITFAGAALPLIMIQNNELKIIEGDILSIGGLRIEKKRTFKTHTIKIDTETMLYLCSDGYQDQFGGQRGKKFMTTNFYNLLLEIHKEPLKKQKKLLNERFNNWINGYQQLDDILIVGIKIN